eukprot:PhF_6_TR26417/c0_g1_i2/m.38212
MSGPPTLHTSTVEYPGFDTSKYTPIPDQHLKQVDVPYVIRCALSDYNKTFCRGFSTLLLSPRNKNFLSDLYWYTFLMEFQIVDHRKELQAYLTALTEEATAKSLGREREYVPAPRTDYTTPRKHLLSPSDSLDNSTLNKTLSNSVLSPSPSAHQLLESSSTSVTFVYGPMPSKSMVVPAPPQTPPPTHLRRGRPARGGVLEMTAVHDDTRALPYSYESSRIKVEDNSDSDGSEVGSVFSSIASRSITPRTASSSRSTSTGIHKVASPAPPKYTWDPSCMVSCLVGCEFERKHEGMSKLFSRMAATYHDIFESLPSHQRDHLLRDYPFVMTHIVLDLLHKTLPYLRYLMDGGFRKRIFQCVTYWLLGIEFHKEMQQEVLHALRKRSLTHIGDGKGEQRRSSSITRLPSITEFAFGNSGKTWRRTTMGVPTAMSSKQRKRVEHHVPALVQPQPPKTKQPKRAVGDTTTTTTPFEGNVKSKPPSIMTVNTSKGFSMFSSDTSGGGGLTLSPRHNPTTTTNIAGNAPNPALSMKRKSVVEIVDDGSDIFDGKNELRMALEMIVKGSKGKLAVKDSQRRRRSSAESVQESLAMQANQVHARWYEEGQKTEGSSVRIPFSKQLHTGAFSTRTMSPLILRYLQDRKVRIAPIYNEIQWVY